MALFKKQTPPVEVPPPTTPVPGAKKTAPTPSRREAEAARRARLNPQLSPKEARRRDRMAQEAARRKQMSVQEEQPARQLLRDLVDSRFNPAEVAMPVLLGILALTHIPALTPYAEWLLYVSWGFILVVALDAFLLWRRFKTLVAQRYLGTPLRGLLMYAFNRQMTFRRWRQPPPRVKRGDSF